MAPPATNSLSVTSQMLWCKATTNCGGPGPQKWPLNWPQNGHSGNFGRATTADCTTTTHLHSVAETSLHKSHVTIYLHAYVININNHSFCKY